MFSRYDGFLAAGDDGKVVLFGAPMDWTVGYRPGCRDAPNAIRHASHSLEEYSPVQDRSLEDGPYLADRGDISMPYGNVERSLALIEEATSAVLEEGRTPLLLGGEHLVSLGAVRALARRYPALRVLQFDAHTDLRESYQGEAYSHATVMRRVVEELGADRVYQFGLRSGRREEFQFARGLRASYLWTGEEALLHQVTRVREELRGLPLYVTVDIDVVDPSEAPGTGSPEPGGPSAADLMASLLALEGLDVVGLDLVEVNPCLDPTGRTQVLAAKILREVILALW